MKSPLFQPRAHRTQIHRVRVWIAGVEVTSKLESSVTGSNVGRGGMNSANFTLSNVHDGFVLTARNLNTELSDERRWRTGGPVGEANEWIKRTLYEYKDQSSLNPYDTIGGTKERRWPLNEGSLVIHINDPVFVASRWPYTEEPLWYPAFKGYIQSKPTSDAHATGGQSSVTVACTDLRTQMNKMRVQMNYFIRNLLAAVTPEDAERILNGEATPDEIARLNSIDPQFYTGFFRDLMLPSNWTMPLPNAALEKVIRVLIVGDEALEVPANSFETDAGGFARYLDALNPFAVDTPTPPPKTIKVSGVGRMEAGVTLFWPQIDGRSDLDKESLQQWHRLYLFGTKREPWTEEELLQHATACTWEGTSAPHAMQLHFLLPSEGSGMAGITEFTFDQGSDQREYRTRWEIIEEYLTTLDYQLTISPVGDVIVEPPLYDFDPSQFGEFEDSFTFDHLNENKSTSFEDDRPDVPSTIVATGRMVSDSRAGQQREFRYDDIPAEFQLRVIVDAPLVGQRIGTNVELMSFPYATDICRLEQFAVLAMQRKLAEASSVSADPAYRPTLSPNRPVHETRRNRRAWIQSINWTLASRAEHGTPQISVDLKYARYYDAVTGEYRLITGSDSLALSYNGKKPASQRGLIVTNGAFDVLAGGDRDRGGMFSTCSEGSAKGGPLVYDGDPEHLTFDDQQTIENCGTDPLDLDTDVRALFEELVAYAQSTHGYSIDLICTHRDPSINTNETFYPDLHQLSPARAFDILITCSDGSAGRREDYVAVGKLGLELGLGWGGRMTDGGIERGVWEDKLVAEAERMIGTPYIWGGNYTAGSYFGVDCSGFVVWCYQQAGILPPKSDYGAHALFNHNQFRRTDSPTRGDICGYSQSGGKITHLGIYLGDYDYVNTDNPAKLINEGKRVVVSSGGRKQTSLHPVLNPKLPSGQYTWRVRERGVNYRPDLVGYVTAGDTLANNSFLNHFDLV